MATRKPSLSPPLPEDGEPVVVAEGITAEESFRMPDNFRWKELSVYIILSGCCYG